MVKRKMSAVLPVQAEVESTAKIGGHSGFLVSSPRINTLSADVRNTQTCKDFS